MEHSSTPRNLSPDPGRRNWTQSWIARLSFLLIAAGLLYVALAGLDWTAFAASLVTLAATWIAATLAYEFLALFARATRWSLLLSSQGRHNLFIAFVGEAVGDLGNSFLPARAGEAVRTVLVARLLDIRLPFVVGTAAVERISDAIFLALTTFVLMLIVPQIPLWLMAAAVLFLLLGLAALSTLLFLPFFSHIFASLGRRLKLPRGFVHKCIEVLHGIGTGSHSLTHHPGKTLVYSAMTAAVWIFDAAAIVCLAHAFRDSLTFPQAMLFLAALGLSSAIPSTPGYIGIFQFIAVSVLVPFGISRAHALGIVLVYQITTILQEALLGGLGWLLLQHRANQSARPAQKT